MAVDKYDIKSLNEEFDKTPLPTMEQLLAMKMSQRLDVREYEEGEWWDGTFTRPTMKWIGYVYRVPGGWIYYLKPDVHRPIFVKEGV